MSTILRLQILMRIPIRIENDDGIGRLQIEAQPSRSRREDEDGVLGLRVVELLEQVGPILVLGRAVQAKVPDAAEVEVVLEDGHDRLRASERVSVRTKAEQGQTRHAPSSGRT